MNFWIGTSGFQYAEWKGNFYPEDLPAAKMLPFYAERFSTTEINYTFHRIPAPKTIDNWKAQTPEKFRFAFLREFPAMRAAFEFRHDSWFDDEIFDLLKSRNIALCIADTADLSTPKKITSDYGYLRLRREDYNESDIERWATFVREQESKWRDAFVYFKHEEAGIGPRLATQMTALLAK